jgi:ankyrin repeat protein
MPLVQQAALLGKCALLPVLLQAGAHFDAALQYSCIKCVCQYLDDAAAAEVVKALLPYCSNVNLSDGAYTALGFALSQSKLQVARALHAAGADVHCTVCSTAHIAAKCGSVAALKWLHSVGVDLRARNVTAHVPLHYACSSSKPDAVKYLLDLPGAADDVHAEEFTQQTPLHYAAAYAAVSGAESVVQLLLQRGAVVDARCADSSTPLMDAPAAPVIKLLLAAGADAAAVDMNALTVLHRQAVCGATAGAICLLLKAGADPTAVDSNGSTAAHVAGMSGHFGLEALLSRAADDYRKKHLASGSSGSSSSSGSSDVAARERVTRLAATLSSMAVNADSPKSSSSSSSVETADVQQQQQQQQQPKAQKAEQPCANCSKLTTKRCRRCAAVYYCSVECQKVCFADAQHRAQCEAKAAEMV